MEKVFFLIVLCVGISNALIFNRTSCPEVHTVENFNLNRITRGIWHLYAYYPTVFESYNKSVAYKGSNFRGKSHSLKLLDVPETSPEYIKVQFYPDENSTKTEEIVTKVMYGNPVSTLELKIVYPLCDHNQYCIAYSCSYDEQKNVTHEYAWIAVRSKKLEPHVKTKLDEYLKTSPALMYDKLRLLDLTEVKTQARRRSG